jgi:hypothetical protein
MIERIFFWGFVRGWPGSMAGQFGGCLYHRLNLLLVGSLFQRILEVRLGRDVGGIVLVDLSTVSTEARNSAREHHTRLYEFSRKVAMMPI